MFSSSLSPERFLILVNLPQPPPPREDKWVAFVDFPRALLTLHKFISCLVPCRGEVGLCLFYCDPIMSFLRYGLALLVSLPTRLTGGIHKADWGVIRMCAITLIL